MCATCLMEFFPSREAALAFMREAFERIAGGETYEAILTEGMPGMLAAHASGDEGHQIVTIPYTVLIGAKFAPEVVRVLEDIEPGLSSPGKHWDERRPLSPAVVAELERSEMTHLLHEMADRRFFGLFLGPREASQRGADAEESKASLYFRVATKRLPIRDRNRQALVTFEAGLPVLLALVAGQVPRLMPRIEARSGDKLKDMPELVAWHLADMYLAATGRYDEIAELDDRWNQQVPPLIAALGEIGLSAHDRALLLGDVMVLHRFVEKESLIPSTTIPLYRNLPQLFDGLRAIGYPRLTEAMGADLRQRYERLLLLISRGMERAKIARIDWAPLAQAIHFEHRRKK